MSEESKKEFVNSAKFIAPFFEVKVEIRVLGQLIWSWTFPPKNKSKN